MYKKTQVTNVSIPLWEGNFRAHCDFTLASFNGHHASTQASSFAMHLDAFLQELFLWVQNEGLNYSVQLIKEGTFWWSQTLFVQHTLYNTDVHSQSASIDTTTGYFDSVWGGKKISSIKLMIWSLSRNVTWKPMHGVTYKVGRIHDAILNRMSAVQGEFQDLLLLLPTLLLNHLLLLAEKCKGFY